jgi:hypothetical protein
MTHDWCCHHTATYSTTISVAPLPLHLLRVSCCVHAQHQGKTSYARAPDDGSGTRESRP